MVIKVQWYEPYFIKNDWFQVNAQRFPDQLSECHIKSYFAKDYFKCGGLCKKTDGCYLFCLNGKKMETISFLTLSHTTDLDGKM